MTADTTSALGTLRDMKNLKKEKFSKNLSKKVKVVESEPEKVVDDLDTTEDGEAGEKAHGAPYQTQLGLHSHLQFLS